jgi:anti-anti-sigma factor
MGSLALNEVCWLDGRVALTVRGVVDDTTVERFERTLDLALGAGSRELIIDLNACQLASAGLAALIRLQRRTSTRPEPLRLVATDVDLVRMLHIVGLTSKLRIYATLDAAVQSCSSDASPAAGVKSAARRPSKLPGPPRREAAVGHLADHRSRAAIGGGNE